MLLLKSPQHRMQWVLKKYLCELFRCIVKLLKCSLPLLDFNFQFLDLLNLLLRLLSSILKEQNKKSCNTAAICHTISHFMTRHSRTYLGKLYSNCNSPAGMPKTCGFWSRMCVRRLDSYYTLNRDCSFRINGVLTWDGTSYSFSSISSSLYSVCVG